MALNTYLPPQLSGPYAQALANAVLNEVLLASGEISYMYNFSIANFAANNDSANLTTAGQLVGYTWPMVPPSLIGGSGLFTFYSAQSGYVNPHFVAYSGFGSVISGGTLSGTLISIYASAYIGASIYANFMQLAAQVKYNGLSLSGIDAVCQAFGNHTITTSGLNNDIWVVFNPDISVLQLSLLNQLFIVFATEPQVFLFNV